MAVRKAVPTKAVRKQVAPPTGKRRTKVELEAEEGILINRDGVRLKHLFQQSRK